MITLQKLFLHNYLLNHVYKEHLHNIQTYVIHIVTTIFCIEAREQKHDSILNIWVSEQKLITKQESNSPNMNMNLVLESLQTNRVSCLKKSILKLKN